MCYPTVHQHIYGETMLANLCICQCADYGRCSGIVTDTTCYAVAQNFSYPCPCNGGKQVTASWSYRAWSLLNLMICAGQASTPPGKENSCQSEVR